MGDKRIFRGVNKKRSSKNLGYVYKKMMGVKKFLGGIKKFLGGIKKL